MRKLFYLLMMIPLLGTFVRDAVQEDSTETLPVSSKGKFFIQNKLIEDKMVVEPKRFTMGLVTPKTTLFLFFAGKVYYNWMQENFGRLDSYSKIYEDVYGITKDTPSDLAVENFVRFLNQLNMGITLMEKDPKSDTYIQIKYKDGNVIKIRCD